MKKIAAVILIALSLATVLSSSALAGFGGGVSVIAEETKIIKSGLLGRKITFSDADFKQGLCISNFDKVKITKLPKSTDGTLMLAGRRVSEGTSVKRKNLPSLVFIPASKEVTETSFAFTIDGYMDGKEIEFIIKFCDKVNYEPKVSGAYADTLAIKTQRDIGVFGKMYATDKEGDDIEYIIVSYPEYGTLTIVDKENGEYVYTPHDSYTGSDSFVYVARDEWGNFSTTQKVNITVSKRMSEVKYADMQNRPEYNAAVAMTAMGIMGGKVIGDGVYFTPDDTVTRAEFLAMAMKAVGIKADTTMTSTYFDDNDKIPTPLLGYVATAQRIGIINGTFKNGELLFNPNDNITKYDAAVIMARLSGASAEGELPVFRDESNIPSWARASVYAMCSIGVFDYNGDTIDATASVTRAECASYLYRLIK
jgi:hypothetical protein